MIPKKARIIDLIKEILSFFQNELSLSDEDDVDYQSFLKTADGIKNNLQNENRIFVVTDDPPTLKKVFDEQNLYTENGKTVESFDLFLGLPGIETKKIRYQCYSSSLLEERKEDVDGLILIQEQGMNDTPFEGSFHQRINWREVEDTDFLIKQLKAFYLSIEYEKTNKALVTLKNLLSHKKKNLEDEKAVKIETADEMHESWRHFKEEIEDLLMINRRLFALELSEAIHAIPSNDMKNDFQDRVDAYIEQAQDMVEELVEKYERHLNGEMKRIKKRYPEIKTGRNDLITVIEAEFDDRFLKRPLKISRVKSFWNFFKMSFRQNVLLNCSLYLIIIFCFVILFQLPLERALPVIGFKYTILGLGQPFKLLDRVDLTTVSKEVMENPVKVGNIGFSLLCITGVVLIVAIIVLLLVNRTLFKLETGLQNRTLSERLCRRWYAMNKPSFFKEQFVDSYEKSILRDLNEIRKVNKERIKLSVDGKIESVDELLLFLRDMELEITKIETEVFYE